MKPTFKNAAFRVSFAAIFIFIATQLFSQTASKQIIYLSGTDNIKTVTWDFFCTGGRKSGYWTTIQVPSCWEQQGFGSYNYGRDYKTYGRNFLFADEQGMYKYRFNVPAGWNGKEIYLVFEGSMTDTEVKINGKPAGEKHQGAFYRFKYNITDKLQYGKANLLEATVSKMSAEASVNNAERLADYWILGGIFRPVYLEAYPKEHIEYLAIDAKANGSFSMNVFPKNLKGNRQLLAEIIDQSGKLVGKGQVSGGQKDSLLNIQTTVSNPFAWTAETPFLYNVNVYLKEGAKTIYQTSEKFGFRTIEVRHGDGIYLNGTKIKMKGVNRHSWSPETGRTLNDSIHLSDVKLIKEMNMNAVRMSHYPPDARFLELCDSLGLYVLDELAGWQKAYSTKAGEKLVREMVIKDVNHPSIIFWDNGNEGGTNKELDDDFLKYDLSKRPVIHPHHRPGNAFSGIDCNHYEDYYSTQAILNDSLIYMPTEFLHSQDDGGGGTSLNDFWELHWASKRGAGGFLWALVDEGIMRTDLNNIIDVNGVNAPDGLVGPHREKEGSVYAIREIYSPVKIKLKELPPSFNGEIPVENRYHFTNLDKCSFRWELVNFRKPGEVFAGYVPEKRGVVAEPSILPLASGTLKIDLPADWKNYDALTLAAYDPFKNQIYKWNWKTSGNTKLLEGVLKLDSKDPVDVTESDSALTMKAGGITITFNKLTGKIFSLTGNNGDRLSFGEGPVLVSGNASFLGMKHYKDSDGEVVEASYTGDMKTIRWKMYGSGWLSLEYEYSLGGAFPFAGISFNYAENFVLGAKWLGKGPYRVWKNRMQGMETNVWENAYNNTQTGSAPWIYPEFKGYFADITWMEMNTVEGKFLIASRDTGLFVRLFNFYGLSGIKPHPDLPVGNISFLDAIPPLGTKLALNISANTSRLGPSGELNKAIGPVRRTVYLYFGLPKSEGKKQQYNVPLKDELF